jgi:hypothetical protein
MAVFRTVVLRGVGDTGPTEEGGEAGRAVCIAVRTVEGRLEDVPVARGDEVRRRSEAGEGGDTARPESPDGERECEGGTAFVLIGRGSPFETIRDLDAGGDVDIRSGDAGRAVKFFGDVLGEPVRLNGGPCEADVA